MGNMGTIRVGTFVAAGLIVAAAVVQPSTASAKSDIRYSHCKCAPTAKTPHKSVAPKFLLRSSQSQYYFTGWGGPCWGPVGEMQLYSGY